MSWLMCLLFALFNTALAQQSQVCEGSACSTRYPAGFFDIYSPVSALDMVVNLPGFELDNGDTGSRGFGGAAGNLLINGERVSAKSDSPSSILARIPAADVEEIVVIRGQTGGLDLVGQSVIANVIRKGDKASGTWNVFGSVNAPDNNLRPFLEATYTDTLAEVNYTLGLSTGEYQILSESREDVVDGQGALLQGRDEVVDIVGEDFTLTLNASFENTLGKFGVNTSFTYFDEVGGETSIRRPANDLAFSVFETANERFSSFEIGVDYETSLGKSSNIKLIGLKTRDDSRARGALDIGLLTEPRVTQTSTAFATVDTETIARLELDFNGIEGHLIEVFAEGAINELDSRFALSELENDQLVAVDVPGAVTQVKEERIEFGSSDAFKVGNINVDALLNAEYSRISQTGGFSEQRSLFFWKPSLTLTYSVDPSTQLRGRLFRSVGQLDFFDFVSQADLGDVELSLGNPTLVPETTVTADVNVERRFGEIGLVSLTAFYDDISDVADLLPLEGILEIPGNIGDGRRLGLTTEMTLPLDTLGLRQGRLDVSGRWQDSSVTDPLSGESRALSNERRWQAEATIRQDLTEQAFAWSVTVYAFDDQPQFGLDEIDVQGRYFDVDAFIETRAFAGLRIRFGVEKALRHGPQRDRQVFDGARNASDIAFRELRDRSVSREWYIDVRGAF